ncbi:RraA family protein [Paenibacillus sp. KACC 21273]|uniref:RraA family protein n=1 Tax=Paenibacillus sp. KACC 21273 TaxID=3025665 RepID=UPI002365478A|nr:RraA family protein [Paenibacillus sp. KACC 21273]WDF48917.1 RraA family protein [Paenibacillus sp. KACC 21273]
MLRIEPRVQGVTAELITLYSQLQPSTLGHLTDFGFLRGIQPLFRPIRMLGNAVTVRIPHLDSTAIRHALQQVMPGDVIVVDMSGDDFRACWGEFRTYVAMKKEVAGVVISGCATDVKVIRELNFPVFATGTSALTTRSLDMEGEVNTPISVCGVTVQPGDLIIGDDDGVFAVHPDYAQMLGEQALAKQQQEELNRQKYGYDLIKPYPTPKI